MLRETINFDFSSHPWTMNRGDKIFYFREDNVPNVFQRTMQAVFLGVKWEKKIVAKAIKPIE